MNISKVHVHLRDDTTFAWRQYGSHPDAVWIDIEDGASCLAICATDAKQLRALVEAAMSAAIELEAALDNDAVFELTEAGRQAVTA